MTATVSSSTGAFLATGRIYVDAQNPDREYPNIYTSAQWIDRADTERMLQALMTSLGFGRSKFAWKREEGRLHPVSLSESIS